MQPPLAAFLEQVLATAQAGLTYSRDPFDIARFEALRAATVTLIASQSELAPDAIGDWIALDSGYPTPKLDVRAFIQNDAGHVLLVQERSDGCWTLPGGWCDIGDSPADAVVLELTLPDGVVDPRRCDCSFCRRRGAIVASVPLSGIRILQGEAALRCYQFNTRTAKHYFCSVCGIYTHHQRRFNPAEYGYNLASLEGVNPFDLGEVPTRDGVHHPADTVAD
ncbi:NUDIX hydrolase N-terminal domain-containing protein [Aeromonas caviae]|jgi:hypothetical protein|nr:NUDIX hydrolase N-terminal domain-containing protein [Aeromonas caviae]MDX7710082.1 NUDIX hydrolase N-terminal domain-containing protein [Aeromonas caviae]